MVAKLLMKTALSCLVFCCHISGIEVCNIEEIIDGNKVKVFKQSMIDASSAVYRITRDHFKGFVNKTVTSQEIQTAINFGITSFKWDYISLFDSLHEYDDNTRDNHVGFVAFRNDDILITFRGTDSAASKSIDASLGYLSVKKLIEGKFKAIQNLRDFTSQGKLISFFNDQVSSPHMHRGFMKAALSSEDQVFEAIKNHLKTRSSNEKELRVIITGHSLGGGIATVFSASMKSFLDNLLEGQPYNLSLVTFASPRVYDADTASFFEEKLGKENIVRVESKGFITYRPLRYGILGLFDMDPRRKVDTLDIVAQLPPDWSWFGAYKHMGRCYHINNVPISDTEYESGIFTLHGMDFSYRRFNDENRLTLF